MTVLGPVYNTGTYDLGTVILCFDFKKNTIYKTGVPHVS